MARMIPAVVPKFTHGRKKYRAEKEVFDLLREALHKKWLLHKKFEICTKYPRRTNLEQRVVGTIMGLLVLQFCRGN